MRLSLCFLLVLAVLLPAACSAQTPQLGPTFFPFDIPWDDSSTGSAVDMSFLNGGQAGSNGYIVVKDGHFVESKTGRRVRFLGTNFGGDDLFPTHADADAVAAHLAKLGFNIVRVHNEDSANSQLWDKSTPEHTKLDPAALDKLDYLIAQFKKNGIYVDINLHVNRVFTKDDGFPDSVAQIPGGLDKRIDNLDSRMIDLQKQFARDYLTHVNPYTGLSYAADPDVAVVEINNENALAGWPGGGTGYFDSLPEPFHGEVAARWNDWLAKRYGSSAELLNVWFAVPAKEASVPENLLSSANSWTVEDHIGDVKLTDSSTGTTANAPDIVIVNPSTTSLTWQKQIHITALSLVEGAFYQVTFRAKADSALSVPVSTADDQPDYHNVGLTATANFGTDWQDYKYVFQARETVEGHTRLTFVLGGCKGTIYLADVQIGRGIPDATLGAGCTLESRNLGLPTLATSAQAADWQRFFGGHRGVVCQRHARLLTS